MNFKQELESLINKHSEENNSNTPDYILCEYLIGCLAAFNTAVNSREKHYDREINTCEKEIKIIELNNVTNRTDVSELDKGEFSVNIPQTYNTFGESIADNTTSSQPIQEDVWNEAHIEFSKYCENFDKYNNRTYQDFFEWAKTNNYILTKK